VTAALLTDKYELTMLAAALHDGTAHRRTTFELFARRLPEGRRYGVVAGTARFVESLPQFTFNDDALSMLAEFLHPGLPGELPVRWRRRRLPRG
jgi:nicotinate phosphoribosyltransferase